MTQTQALTKALILALTAPDDSRATQAAELAESIAQGLNVDQVEQCKANALVYIRGKPLIYATIALILKIILRK
jgi:hypothetical protein